MVRHYQRGGSVMTVLGDRYARLGSPRFLKELRASEAARSRGIATPAIQAGAWYDGWIFRRCDVATAYIPDSADLAAVLFGEGGAYESGVKETLDLIRSVVSGGLLHRDLNLKNILIADRAYVLDLDRCEVVDRLTRSQTHAMHDRFFRSLRKWESKTGRKIPSAVVTAFHEAFFA